MEKQQHRQEALEALAERAERVGEIERAKYLRRIVARLRIVSDATPEAYSADQQGSPS